MVQKKNKLTHTQTHGYTHECTTVWMSTYHLVGISVFPIFPHNRHVAIRSVSLQIFLLLVIHSHSKHIENGSLSFKISFKKSQGSLDFKEQMMVTNKASD